MEEPMYCHQSYYRILDHTGNNEQVTDRYLVVNCAGCCVLTESFATCTEAGRRDYYLLYLCEGVMKVEIDGKLVDMCAGQAIVFYPDRRFRYENHTGKQVVYYWTHFSGYGAGELLERLCLQDHHLVEIGVEEPMVRLFQNLFSEFIRRDTSFELAAASQFSWLCVKLCRCRDQRKEGGSIPAGQQLYNSLSYLHKNYASDISVAMLAAMEHLSPSRYRTVFQKCTGLAPRDYITMLRMKRARELIVQTNLPLKEIAEIVGYHDPLYFSRVFKEQIGMPPRDYRNAS